jgi:hypothetical protein
MGVCKLEFLSDVLSPCGVDFDLVGVKWAFEECVPEVWSDHWSPLVESLHSALTALDVLSIKSQLLVNPINSHRVSLHFPDGQYPQGNEADNHSLGHGGEVLDSPPVNVPSRIFDKPEQVLEASLLVSPVDTLLSESVLFEFPVILFSDGPKDLG